MGQPFPTLPNTPAFNYVRPSDNLPPIGTGASMCKVKLFTPDSQWTWYITECGEEGDPDSCFGFVVGFEPELGYFSLAELREARGSLGLPIERDLHYKPEPLAIVVERHSKWGTE